MTRPPAARAIARIAVCNLDSLASAAALNELFAALEGRIGLVVASRRYGGKYGGFWRQARRNLARSGWRFLAYLSLQLVWYRPLARLTGLGGARLLTLRQLARKYGAAYVATREPNAPEIVARIAKYAPDLIVSLHFDHVFRRPLLALPRHGIVNVHSSLLPAHRGPFPVFWALRLGAERLGVSVHLVDSEELDTGPLLRQAEVERRPGDSVLALDRRLLGQGARLLVDVVRDLEAGAAAAPQAAGQGSYHSYPSRTDVAALYAEGHSLYRWRDLLHLGRRP